jgi:interleukin-1 receptor-associated kinase 1
MQFDIYTIYNLKKKKNPTDELLMLWGNYNHNVTELFVLLCRMRHYESMVPLLPYVDQKYHVLLHNGKANLRMKQRIQLAEKNAKVPGIGNFNQEPHFDKILNQRMAHLAVNPSNSNNLLVAPPGALLASPSAQDNGANGKKINKMLLKTKTISPHVTYSELAIATNEWNQHNILGKGGFGTVYRGMTSY